jgi:hypothetical protein
MAKTLVVPGLPQRYSRQDVEHAAEDARTITAQDKVVQTCLAVAIASRRLYILSREVMDDQIRGRWEVDNGELVVQTLVTSAQEKANDRFSAGELRDDLVQTVLGFLDILVAAEQENLPSAEATDVNAGDDQPALGGHA